MSEAAPTTPADAKTLAETEKIKEETLKIAAETQKTINESAPAWELPKDISGGALDVSRATNAPVGVLASFRSLKNIAESIAENFPGDYPEVWILPFGTTSQAHLHAYLDSQISRLTNNVMTARDTLRAASEPLAKDAPEETKDASARHLQFAGLAASFTAGTIAKLVSSSIPAIASLMKTKTTVVTSELKIPAQSTLALSARFLKERGIGVAVHGFENLRGEELLTKATELESLRDELSAELDKFKVARLPALDVDAIASAAKIEALRTLLTQYTKAELADRALEVVNLIECTAREGARQSLGDARANIVITAIEKTLSMVDQFVQNANTVDALGQSPLSVAAIYEANRDKPRLYIEVSYAGFETQWEELTARKDRGLHFGAVVVTYVLTDKDGSVLKSNVAFDHEAGSTRMGSHTVEWANSVTE